jgi:hypothetical protein
MTQSPDKTIRLQNRTKTNLSLNLNRLRAPASPGLRRSVLLTPINIPAGQYYDICGVMGISYKQAEGLVEASPEVRAFERGGKLVVQHWPPSEEERAAEAAAAPPPKPKPKVEAAPLKKEPVAEPLAEEEAKTEAPAKPAMVVPEEPSMAWTEAKLREYAEAHDIDVKKAKSKTAVLRAIRKK